jgi:hypothetical protein
MKLHVLKKYMTNVNKVKADRAQNMNASAQSRAFRDLSFIRPEKSEFCEYAYDQGKTDTIILNALIHSAWKHTISYYVQGIDSESALEKLVQVEEGTVYADVQGIYCLTARAKHVPLSVGDAVVVEQDTSWRGMNTTRPVVYLFTYDGWVQVSQHVMLAMFEANLCPSIICEGEHVRFERIQNSSQYEVFINLEQAREVA